MTQVIQPVFDKISQLGRGQATLSANLACAFDTTGYDWWQLFVTAVYSGGIANYSNGSIRLNNLSTNIYTWQRRKLLNGVETLTPQAAANSGFTCDIIPGSGGANPQQKFVITSSGSNASNSPLINIETWSFDAAGGYASEEIQGNAGLSAVITSVNFALVSELFSAATRWTAFGYGKA